MLEFDIVIATRNRPEALKLSVPLLLNQSRSPRRLIIADSSDDHEAVTDVVRSLINGSNVELVVLACPPGLTRQRNLGLAEATAPIVMFPDDDALAYPAACDAIMRIWERDVTGNVGGVCAAWADAPPPDVCDKLQAAYKMSRLDRLNLLTSRLRQGFENNVCPDPFIVHGRSRWSVQLPPGWIKEENAVPVEWMTGLCMSYRRELIKRLGFDETLERYAVFEDVEASFKISQTHSILGANSARLFHYRMPGRRGRGLEMGATQILNRAYITCKHAPEGSCARRAMRRYACYKLALYLCGIHSSYGRKRFAGAWRAMRCMHKLNGSPVKHLPEQYRALLEQCIAN